MSIAVVCDACGKKLKAPDKFEGKKGRCPSCGGPILVTRDPNPEAAADAEAAPKDEAGKGRSLRMLQLESFGDIGIVRFATSRVLDGSNVEELGQEFTHIVKDLYAIKLIVNFEKVKYMSSAVLAKLITLNKMIGEEKGKLRFCAIDPSVMEIFKIMKLDKLFKIYDTEEKAVESFGKWFG